MHRCCFRCILLTPNTFLGQSSVAAPHEKLPHAFRLHQILRNVLVKLGCLDLTMWYGCTHKSITVSFPIRVKIICKFLSICATAYIWPWLESRVIDVETAKFGNLLRDV